MDTKPLLHTLELLNWDYSKAELHFILKRTRKFIFSADLLLKGLMSRFKNKPFVKYLIDQIRQICATETKAHQHHCPICDNQRLIRVYNYKREFAPGFNKSTLLEFPATNYGTEIPCPECADKAVSERYRLGLSHLSSQDQQIALMYISTYHPELKEKVVNI